MAFPPFLLSCTFFSFFLLLSGIFFLFYFAGRLIHPPTAFFFSCFTHLIPFNIPSVSVSIPSILHKIAFFLFSLIEYNSLPHRSLVLPHFSTTCQSDPSFFFKSHTTFPIPVSPLPLHNISPISHPTFCPLTLITIFSCFSVHLSFIPY